MHIGIHVHRGRRLLRSWLNKTLAGRVLVQACQSRREAIGHLCFVAATRMSKDDFWSKALLGKRLKAWRDRPGIKLQIIFENRQGLSALYNQVIAQAGANDTLVFIHDDAWLVQEECLLQLRRGLRTYDVVGIAGNQRRVPGQSTWYLREQADGQSMLDLPFLSGQVQYGQVFKSEVHSFGPWPAACELLDGVLLVARADVLRRTGLRFDERFDFHFYDLDFSRAARALGLKIGTWPIQLLHGSKGNAGDERWKENLQRYLEKWGD